MLFYDVVDIDSNNIGDNGVKALAEPLKRNTTMTGLWLSKNSMII